MEAYGVCFLSYSYHGTRISLKETFLTPNPDMERLKPPSELDIDSLNLADVWKEWKEAWVSDIEWPSRKGRCKIVATIQRVLGTKARRVPKTLPNIPGDISQQTVAGILTALETYCVPQKNTTYELYVPSKKIDPLIYLSLMSEELNIAISERLRIL